MPAMMRSLSSCFDATRMWRRTVREAEAIAEAVQRPTMKFVATKTAEQLDLQAFHRVRERLVSQRTLLH
jgi:transposase